MLTCGDDGLVKIVNWEEGEVLKEIVLNAHTELWGITMAHDLKTLFCFGNRNDVLVFDIKKKMTLTSLTGFNESIKCLIETSDNFILTGSYDYRLRTFNSIKV